MGYCTHYELEIIGGHYETLAEIIESREDEDIAYAIDENGESVEFCKWYDHEHDMIIISGQYPELVFKLTGEGEEAGDLWIKYFKNGLIQRCPAKITYDEFDESKLGYRQ